MSTYHIGRDGQPLGQYSLAELQSGFAAGEFRSGDLVWREGMADWIPLSELPEIQAHSASEAPQPPDGLPQASGPVAFESPTQTFAAPGAGSSQEEATYSGPAWENPEEGSYFERAWQTIRRLYTNPTEFFHTMRTEGGLGQPLLFYVAIGWLAMIVNTVLEIPVQFLMSSSAENVLAAFLAPVFIVIFAPALIALGAFISTAMTHLCLMMIGGANKPFEATFRVTCYAYGGAMPVAMVPVCGGFISGVWGMVLEVIGISSAHQISTGKAVLAVLLPVIVCCGLFGGLIAVGFAFFAMS